MKMQVSKSLALVMMMIMTMQVSQSQSHSWDTSAADINTAEKHERERPKKHPLGIHEIKKDKTQSKYFKV